MDRRVFEPRPSGNDVRRRNALSMAIIVFAAMLLWFVTLKSNTHSVTPGTSPPAGSSVPTHAHN